MMSPPNYEPNVKADTNLEIPEPEINRKPDKLDFNQRPENVTENNLNAEKEAEAKKDTSNVTNVPVTKPPVKPERRLRKCRYLVQKKMKKRCTWLVILAVLVVITAGILGIYALKQHFKMLHKQIFKHQAIINGRPYPELIEVDYDKKTTFVKNARSGVVYPADILKDFKQKMVAYRDLDTNICYIDKLNEKFDKSLKEIAKKKKVPPPDTKRVIPSSQPMEAGLLRRFAGPGIDKLCRGAQAYWIVDVRPDIVPLEIAPPMHEPVPVPED